MCLTKLPQFWDHMTFFEGMLLWPGWCGKRGPKVWISNYRTLIRIWEATKYAAEHRCKVVDTACQCPQVCLQTCRPAAMGPKKRCASVSSIWSFKNHIITCISSQFILTVWKTIPESKSTLDEHITGMSLTTISAPRLGTKPLWWEPRALCLF